MEFNPLFLNINNQIGGSGDLKLNKFGNLSYLFKDIIKVKMDGIPGNDGLGNTSIQNQSEKNLTGVSQLSINEDELKNLIETLLAKLGSLSGDVSETGKTKNTKSKKNKDGSDGSVDLNTIVSQLEAGKTIKLNFTGTDENYSLEISKADDSSKINVNSNTAANETIDTSILNIQSPKLLFALKNQAAVKGQGLNLKIADAVSEQTVPNNGKNISLNNNSNPLAESGETQNVSEKLQSNIKIGKDQNVLNSDTAIIKAGSSENIQNINLNSTQAENLFKELKSLIENRETQPELTNKTDEVNFKIKIIKQGDSDSQVQNVNSKSVNKSVLQPKDINAAAKNNEKLFEVNQKIHTEAQKDFKQLENQNNKFSKLSDVSTKGNVPDDVKNNSSDSEPTSTKTTTENKAQNVKVDINNFKENLKILTFSDDVSIESKSDQKEIPIDKIENKSNDKLKIENPKSEIKQDNIKPEKASKDILPKEKVEIKVKADFNSINKEKLQGDDVTDKSSSQVKDAKNISNKTNSSNNVKNNPELKIQIPEAKPGQDSNVQASNKNQDVKEIKNNSSLSKGSFGKNSLQSDVKVNPENKDQTAVKNQDVKEAKSDTGLKVVQNSNSKDQSSFNQQASDQQQSNKDSNPSIAVENSSDKNISSKEAKTDNSTEKLDSQKTQDAQLNSTLKNLAADGHNSDVKETKGNQQFSNQPKVIKPSQILNEISSFMKKGEVKSLVLKLTPENLGNVKVEVNMVDKAMHANIEVENESVKQTIQTNFNQLRNALVQSGITVAGLTISLNNGGEKNTKASEPKRKTSVDGQAIKTEEKSTVTIPKKMGYNTYEYLA